jgi:hypothetical protein
MLGITDKPPINHSKSRGLFKLVSKELDLCDNSALQFLKNKRFVKFLMRTEAIIHLKFDPTSVLIENKQIWLGTDDGYVYHYDYQNFQQSFNIFKNPVILITSTINFLWVLSQFFFLFFSFFIFSFFFFFY